MGKTAIQKRSEAKRKLKATKSELKEVSTWISIGVDFESSNQQGQVIVSSRKYLF